MTAGAFKIENESDLANYNIKPKKEDAAIPKDQADLQARIYATRGVIKLLQEQGVFTRTEDGRPRSEEFAERILQIAKVGLTGENPQTELATAALEQLRGELLARKGKSVIYRYLVRLAGYAAVGVALGVALEWLSRAAPIPRGYGVVIAGSMVGAWLSAAANRRDVTFAELPDFLGSSREPIVRVAFVAVLACVVALFIHEGILKVVLGTTDFQRFDQDRSIALLLGVIAGIGERALSVKVLQRAGEFTTK